MNFWNFGNIFRELKIILAFSGIIFKLKMIFINPEINNFRNFSKP